MGEAPAVIAAAQRRLHPGVLADQRPAVGADVGQAVDLVAGVAGQQQRLVEDPLEQGEGVRGPGDADGVGVRHQLPAPREDALAGGREPARIAVDLGRQGRRPADVRVDGPGEGHGRLGV